MLHRKSKGRPMSHTQRACWLLLAMMKSSCSFTPIYSANNRQMLLSAPLHLVTDESAEDARIQKRGPFRSAVRRILRTNKRKDESVHMLTKDLQQTEELSQEQFIKGLRLGNHVNTDDFILQNFQNTGPNDIFPPTKEHRNVLTSEQQEETITKPESNVETTKTKTKSPTTNEVKITPRSKYEGGTIVHRMTRTWFQNLLTGIIERRSKVPPVGLVVKVAPRTVMKNLCRGQFRVDASIDFTRVVFRNLRLTGGSLEARRMTLGMLWSPRYVNQFDIHAHNCTLTEDDLFESSCVRNGLARLLVRILTNAGLATSKVKVTAVNIVPSGKIACSGYANTAFGSKVSFEVRSGIDMSSRGHIVTFPGLEVSLGPSLGVFVPVVPEIDLDIGHNARLRSIFVDGRRRRVTFCASTTVTPTHTMKLHKYRQHADSYAAQFSFDVGRFVTNLGNFTN